MFQLLDIINYLKSYDIRKQREKADKKTRDIILKAFNYRGFKKGSRSIKMTLENKFGITFNKKSIKRIMRKYNIVCPFRKSNPYKSLAKATKEHKIVENILKRNLKQDIPGKVLLTYITIFITQQKLYGLFVDNKRYIY